MDIPKLTSNNELLGALVYCIKQLPITWPHEFFEQSLLQQGDTPNDPNAMAYEIARFCEAQWEDSPTLEDFLKKCSDGQKKAFWKISLKNDPHYQNTVEKTSRRKFLKRVAAVIGIPTMLGGAATIVRDNVNHPEHAHLPTAKWDNDRKVAMAVTLAGGGVGILGLSAIMNDEIALQNSRFEHSKSGQAMETARALLAGTKVILDAARNQVAEKKRGLQ